jgi:hypothetical protein
MCLDSEGPGEEPEEDYSGWPLRDRLELLAFDARLAGVPAALIAALWHAMDLLDSHPSAPAWGHDVACRGLRRGAGDSVIESVAQLHHE